jgi:3-aminobutyryl-CoA ammonia-lyase
MTRARPEPGLVVTHRRYVPHSAAHYGGALVDGAYTMALFGDVATELCLRTDGDEGLLASYAEVAFHAPVIAGDVLEVTATLVRVGNRSRTLELSSHICCRAAPDVSASAGRVLEPPLLAVSARCEVVVPAAD